MIPTLDAAIPLEEGEAASYIAAVRWPNGPICPFCREKETIAPDDTHTSTGRYLCSRCTRSFTIAAGTIIERSALPISKWLRAFQILGEGQSSSLDTIIRGIFHPVDTDPDLRLSVDGRTVWPEVVNKLAYSFVVSEAPAEIYILSRYFVPAKQDPSSVDHRRLGVGIASITIVDSKTRSDWSHDDPALVEGFHAPEFGQRWTTGRARVPIQCFSKIREGFTLVVNLSHRNGLYSIE